ncbi:30S ribosomal protein S16, partial [Candidatus Peregrinibacteria bacterium]|nr:30S ribosomal protein S16 [Candidatus Peregrinibacteria bacterium]
MLKIRLSRAGKKAQPSYKVVVQEHSQAVKGKFIEQLGIFRPTDDPKVFTVDVDRVKYWISVGAQPSDRVAVLLKNEGLDGMEKYIGPRNKQKKKK